MERYTLQQRIEIISNVEKLAVTVRINKAFVGRREAPCRTAIQAILSHLGIGKPRYIVEKPLHPQRVTVWRGYRTLLFRKLGWIKS